MELSEAKKELEQLSASIGPVDSEYLKEHEPENYKLNQAIDTVLKVLDNSISKDDVRTIINIIKNYGIIAPEDSELADDILKKYLGE